jgi:hypothetical protein
MTPNNKVLHTNCLDAGVSEIIIFHGGAGRIVALCIR